MKKNIFILLFLFIFLISFCHLSLHSSKKSPQNRATDPETVLKSWEYHQKLKNESIFKNLKWRSVGPEIHTGRISSISAHPDSPFVIYVAAGAGNLWKTSNNGTTWEPIFDRESTFTIGDIDIAKSDPDVIWVGSGEELMARSSFAGTGVFKSTDAGKTWQNMGLHDTHHIGRIVIDPLDPDIVYVAAIGHNYTFNEQRGLFKTTDGGKTWNKVLYISEKVGVVEVVMDPTDNKTLYVATWERDRKAWNNVESGEGSGIYKTTDAGITWKGLTNGFPAGKHVGRIGLDVCASKPNVIYALLDNQAPRPEEKKTKEPISSLTILQVQKMTKEEFMMIDPKILGAFLRQMGVPREYTADAVFEIVKKGELTPKSFAQYLLDLHLDRKLHVTNVIGGEVYRSDDKGETWKKVNKEYFDGFFSTYGYSFCDVRVAPDDEDKIYVLGIRMYTSDDGGKTYRQIAKIVHADHHDLWIDPVNPDRLLLGNDGGLNVSYDRGETWQEINNIPIGEFYTISVDMATPYNIYGGLQDNGTLFGPSNHTPRYGVEDPWKVISGGDGFHVFVDPVDSNTVYSSYQFGPVLRKNLKDGSVKNIMPKSKIGELPLRCNWMTPYIISHHNNHIIYYGANKLLKSLDRGDHWWPISDDLTTSKPYGDVPYSTITTISESPLRPGLLYVGTDDGNVWVTRNDGVTWELTSKQFPKKWVSRVVASQYEEGTVYVSLTGYRDDDFEKYLFMSTDFGKTLKSIAGNLPTVPINVIREDAKNRNILYVGTDLGIYVSIDRGKFWYSICNNLPTTPVHDLVIHPRENELVIGTHGRSAFVLDVQFIQKLVNENIQEKEAYLFNIDPVKLPRWRRAEAGATICYFLKKAHKIKISILDESGKLVKELKGTNDPGFNLATWNLSVGEKEERFVNPGNYRVEILAENIKLEGKIEVQASQR